jgi:HK97 family phage major capsid protein/HK97 family phage prohead protease
VQPDANLETSLVVKALDAERRTFRGVATTPDLDRQGHSVDPFGATFANPVPLLWQHDQSKPIGTVTFFPATAAGIAFEASMPVLEGEGPLQDRINDAWQSIKAGIVRGVSIGFRVLGDGIERLANGTLRLRKTEIVELSLVTIPANVHASISVIKSLAALRPNMPGVPGAPRSPGAKDAPRMSTQTIAEQITTTEASRSAKAARMVGLMTAAAEAGRTLDASETEEFDGLDVEVKGYDESLVRLRRLEGLQVAGAVPIVAKAAGPGAIPFVRVKSTVPPGTAFARLCMAIVASGGNKMQAVEIAKQWKSSTPEVELYLKAAIAPGSTTDPAWAGPLAQVQNLTGEFIDLLRPKTILGKIPGLKQVPFNVSVPVQNAGGVYGWVGQGFAKPVTKLGFTTATLGIAKAAGIIILTEELVRTSSPSAEAIVRNDMIAGIAEFLDHQFIDPAKAATANISPASITNGLTPITATTNPLADIHALIAALSAANIPLGGVTLIMSETNALTLGMSRDAMGNRAFPNLTAEGGSIDGINVVTSNVAGTMVIALQPNLILYADDGGVSIDVSREATVQMDSTPDTPTLATTVQTSLWQNNLVGLRAERFINWSRPMPAAVAYVSGASYSPTSAGFSVPNGNGGTQAKRGQAAAER